MKHTHVYIPLNEIVKSIRSASAQWNEWETKCIWPVDEVAVCIRDFTVRLFHTCSSYDQPQDIPYVGFLGVWVNWVEKLNNREELGIPKTSFFFGLWKKKSGNVYWCNSTNLTVAFIVQSGEQIPVDGEIPPPRRDFHRGQTHEHAQRCKFWSPARQFPAQNFKGKILQEPGIKTLIVICERKQK